MKSEKIKKVLFADDDSNIRLIVRMSLEGLTDWTVLLASSGAEALRLIEAEKPDLLLLDVMMPDADGETVLEEMKMRLQENSVPTIFITAKVQSQEISKYKALGALGVIMKPFHPVKLATEIKQIVDSSAMQD
ncbi:MAG: response regulator [Candidatus Obscuribacterales bacterium]|nr:response regulator [Candidatus Obscuribacterales bacterium]